MKTKINEMVKMIAEKISNDLYAEYKNDMHDEVLQMVLKAYNEWQESEKDGVDYIFNIYDKDDLMACVKGGMTAKEVAEIYKDATTIWTPYYFFGSNYPSATPIKLWSDLFDYLVMWLEDVLPNIIAYPWCSTYRPIYTKYVTDVIINYNEFDWNKNFDWNESDDDKSADDALAELKKKMNSDCYI